MAEKTWNGNITFMTIIFIILIGLGTAYYFGAFGQKIETPASIIEKAEKKLKIEKPALPSSPLPSNPSTPIPPAPSSPPKAMGEG